MSDMDVARDDLALDAIAAGTDPASDDAALTMLFALREDLEPPVRVESERVAPPVAPVVPLRPRQPSKLLFALAAAAGLVVGGTTAGLVAVADRPGEFLHTTHVAVLGTDSTTAAEVTALLDEASVRLARGDRTGARTLLNRAGGLVEDVPDEGERAHLRTRLATLVGVATERPSPSPSPSPNETDDVETGTPEPRESDDSSGSGSGSDDDSSGPGSGSDDSGSDSSGSGSDGSGSDDSSGSGSGGSGSGSDDAKVDSSGSGSGHD